MGNAASYAYPGVVPPTTAGVTPTTSGSQGALTPVKVVSVGIAGSAFALLLCIYFALSVSKHAVDPKRSKVHEKLAALSRIIHESAKAYLYTQYKWLCLWVAVLGIIIAIILRRNDSSPTGANNLSGLWTMISFIVGSALSGAAGFLGMWTATNANGPTAQACEKSIAAGLQVSFASGAVMGNGVTGLALGGLWVFYLIWTAATADSAVNAAFFDQYWGYIAGFGFGASSIGMFARVGGGVFTKAADVGADLVGKVEQGIPEDDARNPAVIADNVGDNVGDVAGMGADLFESYAGALIATATLSPELYAVATAGGYTSMTASDMMMAGTALPFWVYGFGVVTSFIGIALVRNYPLDEKTDLSALLKLINWGVYLASLLSVGTIICACVVLFDSPLSWRLVGCNVIGLVAGIVIANFTEYCTSYEDAPTRSIAAASEFGPAPVIIKGLGVGMLSVSVPVIAIVITILACNALTGLYGVSIAAVGMLCTLPITLATDAYGPVADNAGGLAEMSGMGPEIRSRTDRLDSLGNTTAATGKGLAIGSALLTAVGLIAAFLVQSGGEDVLLGNAVTLAGVLIGCGLPFVFGALTMLSVDRGARSIITEVRRQFAECPALVAQMSEEEERAVIHAATTTGVRGNDGKMYPDTKKCVIIATEAAIQEMVLPGTLAVFVPVGVGFLLGPSGLGGLLAGSLGTCFCLALTMANAGGAWDNSKKWNEKCAAEGEPAPTAADPHAVTYTFFGVKSEKLWEQLTAGLPYAAAAGAEAKWAPFLRKQDRVPRNKEEADALGARLYALYHERTHAATVAGDTVGDPFKDTSGPALNVLSKTQTMVALMLAPAYKSVGTEDGTIASLSAFGKWGTIIAAIMLVVIGTLLYIAMRFFRKVQAARDAEALAAKEKAIAHNAAAAHAAAGAAANPIMAPHTATAAAASAAGAGAGVVVSPQASDALLASTPSGAVAPVDPGAGAGAGAGHA